MANSLPFKFCSPMTIFNKVCDNLTATCLDNNNKWTRIFGCRRCRTRTSVCSNKSSSSNSSNRNSSITDQIYMRSTGVPLIMSINNRTMVMVATKALQSNCTIRPLQQLALNAMALPNMLHYSRTRTREAFFKRCISRGPIRTFTIVTRLITSQSSSTKRK